MTWTAATYLVYLAVTVPLTIWVASTLSRHGGVFLADVFDDREELAGATNALLVVGFYLLNLGFVVLFLGDGTVVAGLDGMLATLSTKVGTVMLVLGVLHFGNVLVFNSIRRRSRADALRTPPLPPQGFTTAPFPAAPYGPAAR